MLNVNKLKAKLAGAGMSQKELAVKIGISENTMTQRMTKKSDFTLKEIRNICKELNITTGTEKAEIFLA